MSTALAADARDQSVLRYVAPAPSTDIEIPPVQAFALLGSLEALGGALRYLGRVHLAEALRRAAFLVDVPPILVEAAADLREIARVTREDPPRPTATSPRSWQIEHARRLCRVAEACDAERSALHAILVRGDVEDAGLLARAAIAEIPEAWRTT